CQRRGPGAIHGLVGRLDLLLDLAAADATAQRFRFLFPPRPLAPARRSRRFGFRVDYVLAHLRQLRRAEGKWRRWHGVHALNVAHVVLLFTLSFTRWAARPSLHEMPDWRSRPRAPASRPARGRGPAPRPRRAGDPPRPGGRAGAAS